MLFMVVCSGDFSARETKTKKKIHKNFNSKTRLIENSNPIDC